MIERITPHLIPRRWTLAVATKLHRGIIVLFMAGRSINGFADGQPEFVAYVGVQIPFEQLRTHTYTRTVSAANDRWNAPRPADPLQPLRDYAALGKVREAGAGHRDALANYGEGFSTKDDTYPGFGPRP